MSNTQSAAPTNLFYENARRDIPKNLVRTLGNGLHYLNWAQALALAGRPAQDVCLAKGKPGLPLFDGLIVAVEQGGQMICLPVLDMNDFPVKASVGDQIVILQSSISRCRAKAIAMCSGVGISLYADYGCDGQQFVSDLGVKPGDMDLSNVNPLTRQLESGVRYVHWAAALAAAKISDENFSWEVQTSVFNELSEPQMYLTVSNGFFVGVKVTWHGESHTEYLPIMDASFFPMSNPDSADWNRAIMRCLTKAIAVKTGYGLQVYASEPEERVAADSGSARSSSKSPQAAEVPAEDPAIKESKVKQLLELLKEKGKQPGALLMWLGVEGDDISVLSIPQLNKSLQALNPGSQSA